MSKPKILIIDDEPVSSLSLEALLSGQGYELIFADHGTAGLAMAKAELPDLVLLDVMMPDMDGYEVCRQMRGHETLAEVPILMITALDDQLSRLAGLQAGADDFLVKPFNAGELRARVGTITRLNRYRRLLSQSGQLQWLMDNSQEGYVILDSRSRVSYANIQARNYLGLPEQGNLPALDFFAQANKHYRFTPAADSGAWNVPPIPSPAYMVRPETQYYGAFWLSVKEVPNRAGPDAGRLIQLHDCTEDMSKHIALGKFHNLIEHKMNTPVHQITMSLSLVASLVEEGAGHAEIGEFLKIAQDAADRLATQVRQIAEYISIRPAPGKQPGLEITQLEGLLRDVARDLGLQPVKLAVPASLRGVRIALSDSTSLMVLYEILGNAKKFHPSHAPAIECAVTAVAGNRVCVSLSDDGLHLSPQQLSRAFMPYQQIEKHSTGAIPGMGLGLSRVAILVLQVGGQIHMRNREDRVGITVEMELPIA